MVATKTIEQMERLFRILFPNLRPKSFTGEQLERFYSFVFTPNSPYLPSEVFDNCDYIMHLISLKEIVEGNKLKTIEQINDYLEEEERLSLIECEKELIAMGIPTVVNTAKRTKIGMDIPDGAKLLTDEETKQIKGKGSFMPHIMEDNFHSKGSYSVADSVSVCINGILLGSVKVYYENAEKADARVKHKYFPASKQLQSLGNSLKNTWRNIGMLINPKKAPSG